MTTEAPFVATLGTLFGPPSTSFFANGKFRCADTLEHWSAQSTRAKSFEIALCRFSHVVLRRPGCRVATPCHVTLKRGARRPLFLSVQAAISDDGPLENGTVPPTQGDEPVVVGEEVHRRHVTAVAAVHVAQALGQ